MDVRERVMELLAAVDRSVQRVGPSLLRFGVGLLWLSNVSWKVPPDFGRVDGGCRGLCAYVSAGVEHPVLPGSAWFFREVVAPNLVAFGWITLVSEAALAAMLLAGRYLKTAAALGIAQSLGILVSVANADHEWYWSYLLMVLAHLAVWMTATSGSRPRASTVGGWVIGYGLVVAIANGRRGFTGGAGEWLLFRSRTDLPGDFGRNVFPGSIALGLVIAVLGVVVVVLSSTGGLTPPIRRVGSGGLLGLSALMLATFDVDGTLLGLGSRASSAAVLAALGLSLALGGESEAVDADASVADVT